jgi:hypothetical protein
MANPYAPPKAAVLDAPVPVASEPTFFPVSLTKLAVMSAVSFGLYEIYWFYKNWQALAQMQNRAISAPVRAVFYPVTAYWLFKPLREHAGKHGAGNSLSPSLLAVAVFLLSLTWRLPDPYWLIGLLTFVPLLPIQSAVNEVNGKLAPGADANATFSGQNIAVIVIGGLLLVFGTLGMLLPEPG